MRSFVRKILSLFIVTSIIVSCFAFTSGAEDAKTQSLQDQIDSLGDQIEEYEEQIRKLEEEHAGELQIKANLDAVGEATRQKIETSELLFEQLAAEIEATAEDIAKKEAAIEVTFNKFLERMVTAYEDGDISYLSIILNSSDMGDFLSRMDMVDSMLEYDRSIKTQYEEEKAELEAAKASLEDSKAKQAEVLAELEADRASYEALAAEQEAYIRSLESDLSRANSALEEAKAADNALNDELQKHLAELAEQERLLAEQKAREEAERAAKEEAARRAAEEAARAAEQSQNNTDETVTEQEETPAPAPVYSDTGGFIWPLVGYTYVTSGFGWRMLNGVADNHLGIDIGAPSGVPIYASKSGTVVTATFHHSYGNYVVLNHGVNSSGHGESTLYAHMSAIACSPGQYVNQGDIIGYVGCTGYSFGAHLHFEVRIDGVPNDPLNFVSP